MTADIHWLGNVTASDGRPCGAFGTLADLRVYNDALSRRQVQELDAAAPGVAEDLPARHRRQSDSASLPSASEDFPAPQSMQALDADALGEREGDEQRDGVL